MKVGGFNILDFLDRAEPVYGDRIGVVDEPDQPADSRGQLTWRQVDINQTLTDDQVDITKPEALVYELDANGEITGLVAHEYIVPIDA